MSRCQCFEWFEKFKKGENSIHDKKRTGRPAEVRNDTCIQKVKEIIDADRRQTVDDVCLSAGISHGSCHTILRHDLGFKKSGFYVPHKLNQEQKEKRVEVCLDLLDQTVNDEKFLEKIVTGDESCVYPYDCRVS